MVGRSLEHTVRLAERCNTVVTREYNICILVLID